MNVELGIVEGYYGKTWTWEQRAETIAFLAPHGYTFYHYAPKADPFLRRRWLEDHPRAMADQLSSLASHCRVLGVRFGVGLSPYELYASFDASAKEALQRKLAFLDSLPIQDLAILFDDMRGDTTPDLAHRQVEIIEWAAERTRAGRLVLCPTYYTDDANLDRVFGPRPAGYLEQLGSLLDPAIQVYWTGPEVCSRELSPGHLRRVGEQLQRRPFLWDNYPVNDGQRMSQYLHLRGFTGRHAAGAGLVAAHAINPALQPTLTRIPALTLVDAYDQGPNYDYLEAFTRAASTVLGDQMAQLLREDLLLLQDIGLDRLGDKEGRIRQRYGPLDHPGAREIVAWLDGEYRITDAIVQTQ